MTIEADVAKWVMEDMPKGLEGDAFDKALIARFPELTFGQLERALAIAVEVESLPP